MIPPHTSYPLLQSLGLRMEALLEPAIQAEFLDPFNPAMGWTRHTVPVEAILPSLAVTPEHLAAARIIMSTFERDEHITRDDDRPYLDRWHVVHSESKEGHIFLHRFDGDDSDPHCHPWPSVSLNLAGTQIEYWWETGSSQDQHVDTIPPGTVTWRSAAFTHRLERTGDEPPITLFVTGKKTRDWGFWSRDAMGQSVFRPWEEVHAERKRARRQ